MLDTPVTGDGQQLQLVAEDELEDEAGPEHRHGDAEQGQQGDQVVAARIRAQRSDDACGDADAPGDKQRGEGERQRRRKGLRQQLTHVAANLVRLSEVALQHPAHVAQVALEPRIIQMHLPPHPLDHVRLNVLAHHQRDGIARHNLEQDEGQEGRADDDRHGLEDAAEDVGEHDDSEDVTGNE